MMKLTKTSWSQALLAVLLCMSAGAVTAKEIVVAQIAPFGGNLAVAGRDFNLGAMLAFDEVNVTGGVNGNKVRLVSRDDGFRPAETVSHLKKLVATEVPVALIGMWGTDNVRAVVEDKTLERLGIPVVGVRSGDGTLRGEKQLFHFRASYRDEAIRMVEQIAAMGIKRVAVVHENEAFGHEALAVSRESLKKHDIELIAESVLERNSLDVNAAVNAITKSQPQAIFMFASTNAVAALTKPLRERKVPAFILTTSSVEAENLVNQIKPEMARGVAIAQSVPNPARATTPIARSLLSRMRSLGIDEQRANFASMEGYIAARIVIEALKLAGKDPKPEQMFNALERLSRLDLGGFVVKFGPGKHEGSRYVDLSVISREGRVLQ